MITIPGTPSNHANMYLMTYSFLPAPRLAKRCAPQLLVGKACAGRVPVGDSPTRESRTAVLRARDRAQRQDFDLFPKGPPRIPLVGSPASCLLSFQS